MALCARALHGGPRQQLPIEMFDETVGSLHPGRLSVAIMTDGASELLERVLKHISPIALAIDEIRVSLQGLLFVGEFWVVDSHVAGHTSIGSTQIGVPDLLDGERCGGDLGIAGDLSELLVISPLIGFPLGGLLPKCKCT